MLDGGRPVGANLQPVVRAFALWVRTFALWVRTLVRTLSGFRPLCG